MASGFIIRKKAQLTVEKIVGDENIFIIDDKPELKDIDQGIKNNVNQIDNDLLKNINSASWSATLKMIDDREKNVTNSFTDKFFIKGKKKGDNDGRNTAKKILIALTNGIDAYRRIQDNSYVGTKDIPTRFKNTTIYINSDLTDNEQTHIWTIANKVFNRVHNTLLAIDINDVKNIYNNTNDFVSKSEPSAPPDEPTPVAGLQLAQTEGIETIGIRYPLSRILGPA